MKGLLLDEMLEGLCFFLFNTSCARTAVPVGQEHPTFVILATGLFCGLGLSQNFFGCSIRAPFTTCLTETESVAGPSR